MRNITLSRSGRGTLSLNIYVKLLQRIITLNGFLALFNNIDLSTKLTNLNCHEDTYLIKVIADSTNLGMVKKT